MIGCGCEVCSSDNPFDKRLRCSAILQHGDAAMLIDCGPDVRQQLLQAGVKKLLGVVITHEHNDHIIGLDDLRPFIFRQHEAIKIFAEPRVQESIRERFSYAFAKTPYPGAPKFELLPLEVGKELSLANLPKILPLRVEHGSLPIIGFKIGNLAYLTDVKTVSEESRHHLQKLKVLITSALHHFPHHSHMNLSEALSLVKELSPDRAILIHMSHQMGLHAEVGPVLPKGVVLGSDGMVVEV